MFYAVEHDERREKKNYTQYAKVADAGWMEHTHG